jgi:hypothetical protein
VDFGQRPDGLWNRSCWREQNMLEMKVQTRRFPIACFWTEMFGYRPDLRKSWTRARLFKEMLSLTIGAFTLAF